VQPVSSEARFNLISGVWPIASTTSLLNIMGGVFSCRSMFASGN
jgi:hypothetical protein